MTPNEQEDEQFYRDTESIAFPKLDDHQLSLLEPSIAATRLPSTYNAPTNNH